MGSPLDAGCGNACGNNNHGFRYKLLLNVVDLWFGHDSRFAWFFWSGISAAVSMVVTSMFTATTSRCGLTAMLSSPALSYSLWL